MADDIEDLLSRFASKAPKRLAQVEGGSGCLAEINMAVRIKKALDKRIWELIHGSVINEVDGDPHQRPPWREIGEAMEISAQAAHRKYRIREDHMHEEDGAEPER